MIVNANSIVQYVIQIKNGIMKHVNVNVKIMVKKIKVGILAHAYVRIVSTWNLKKSYGIISVVDIVSTKTTNLTSTPSINCHSMKVKDCYILDTVLLAIILLLINITFCYHYAK